MQTQIRSVLLTIYLAFLSLLTTTITTCDPSAKNHNRHGKIHLPFTKTTLFHTAYFAVLLYLFLGVYAARNEWIGANGYARGSALVRAERERYLGGGWEWGPWEAFKGMLQEMLEAD